MPLPEGYITVPTPQAPPTPTGGGLPPGYMVVPQQAAPAAPQDAPPPSAPQEPVPQLERGDPGYDPAAERAALMQGSLLAAKKTVAGIAQFTSDLLVKHGAMTPEYRDMMTTHLADQLQKAEESGDPHYKTDRDVGEVLGNMFADAYGTGKFTKIPSVIKLMGNFWGRVLTSSAIGAGISGSKFIKPEDKDKQADFFGVPLDTGRLGQAESGGLWGAAGEVSFEPLRIAGTKAITSKYVQDGLGYMKRLADQYTNQSTGVAKSFQDVYNRVNMTRRGFYAARNNMGDRLVPQGIGLVNTADEINKLISTTTNKETKKTLGNAVEALSGLTQKQLAAVPQGISAPARQQIIKQLSGNKVLSYSLAQDVSDSLERAIKTAQRQGDGKAATLLINAKNEIGKVTGAVENRFPSLKAAAVRAKAYNDNVANITNRDEFEPLRDYNTKKLNDFYKANTAAVKIATGPNQKVAQDLYNNLTPAGRKAMQQSIMMHALDEATIGDTKVIDPAKMKEFLEKSPAMKTFFPKKEDQEWVKGFIQHVNKGKGTLENVLKHAPGKGLMAWGLFDAFAHGQVKEGVEKVVGGFAMQMLSSRLFSLTNTQQGLNFLRASGKLGPDSPAMTQAFNRLMVGGAGVGGASAGSSIDSGGDQ